MAEFLFLYGTLLPGLAPPEIARVAAELRFAGEASVQGRLYDLGDFPGAVLNPAAESPAAEGRIFGSVFTLPEDPAILQALDDYEEFVPSLPQGSQFVRKRATVSLAAGGTLECWIYVYNRFVTAERRIASGRWKPAP